MEENFSELEGCGGWVDPWSTDLRFTWR